MARTYETRESVSCALVELTRTFRVVQNTSVDSPNPVTVSTPAFVGRDQELAALTDALGTPPAVILVEGEAGIGKSRLIQEGLAAAGARRPTTLTSVCPPLREPLTLGPVVDAFRGAAPRLTDLALTDLAGALRPLFPEWSGFLPPALDELDDAKAARHRLFRALAELIGSLDVDLLVVEDAQWADEVTLEFLLFLIANQHVRGPSLVVSYRPEELDDRSLLLRLTSRLPAGVTQWRVALAPLDRGEVAALVSSMLDGEPMSDEFSTFLHDRTDGVPFAVEESVRLLCDRADVIFRDGQWVRLSLAELQVPPTVRDSTRERVGRLSSSAQRVLEAAATLAEPANEATLAATGALSTRACRTGVAESAAAGLLDGDDRGRWRIRHDLAATAVYEAIASSDRRALHQRAGQMLAESQPPPAAQLARHFRVAGDHANWARYAEQAALRAIASGDHTSAVVHLDDVLSAAELPSATRTRISCVAATAALGRREPVDEVYHRLIRTLRALVDTGDFTDRQRAETRNYLGRLLINTGEAEAALTELERAVAHLDHDPAEAAKVMTYLGWAYAGPWPASRHLHWLQRAAELVPLVDSPADRLSLAGNRAAALLMLGDEGAWEAIAELPTEATASGERLDIARISVNIGTGALMWGRYAEAERHLATGSRLAEAEGSSRLGYNVLLEQANLDWYTGRWNGLAQRAEDLGEADRDRPGVYLASIRLIARLSAAAGRRRLAEENFRLVLDEDARLGAFDATVEPAAALGRMALADHDPRQAVRVTEAPMRMIQTKGVWVWATEIAPVRVEALLAAGETESAERLTRRLARGLRGRNAPAPRAALALCRALLVAARGEQAQAAESFARAARSWEALPRPYDAMLAGERRATAMLAAGQDAGLDVLAEVYERLFRLGARGDADRVAHQLRSHGAEVPRLWRGGRRGYGDQLSPRELEVVRLVVAGKTNREIARILTKSPSTVDQQLRSAMRKLNVTSRTALAVTAVEAGVFAENDVSTPERD